MPDSDRCKSIRLLLVYPVSLDPHSTGLTAVPGRNPGLSRIFLALSFSDFNFLGDAPGLKARTYGLAAIKEEGGSNQSLCTLSFSQFL